MALDEFPKLIGESAHPVVFLLPGNLGTNLYDIRLRHGKGAVASAPGKFPRQNAVGVHTVGGTALQKLDQFLDRHIGWEIDKGMNMIGVYVIDLHVNALGVGVLTKVTGEAGCSLLVE
jgi:hypothetical protein